MCVLFEQELTVCGPAYKTSADPGTLRYDVRALFEQELTC